jgi:hypothetical protein
LDKGKCWDSSSTQVSPWDTYRHRNPIVSDTVAVGPFFSCAANRISQFMDESVPNKSIRIYKGNYKGYFSQGSKKNKIHHIINQEVFVWSHCSCSESQRPNCMQFFLRLTLHFLSVGKLWWGVGGRYPTLRRPHIGTYHK